MNKDSGSMGEMNRVKGISVGMSLGKVQEEGGNERLVGDLSGRSINAG